MELDLLSLAEYFNHASLPVLAVDCFLHLPDPSTRMQHIEVVYFIFFFGKCNEDDTLKGTVSSFILVTSIS